MMKVTYVYSREALKNKDYENVMVKKAGNMPSKRKKENIVAVLRKLQLDK